MTPNKAKEAIAKLQAVMEHEQFPYMSEGMRKLLEDFYASAERDAVERTLERCRRIALDLKDKHLDDSLKYLGGYIEACEEIADVIKKQST